MKTKKRPFWFGKIPCLLLVFILALSPTTTLLAESDTGDTEGITNESMESSVPAEETAELSAQTEDEEPENTTYTNSISGILWLDANDDGIHDADEQPIEGYTVSLYEESDTDHAVQTAVTAADGTYSFSEIITPGSYVVGVVSATVGGQEYLLPFVGIQNDNKFAIASGSSNAYSEAISVGEDTTVTGVDAGMRIPPRVQTRVTPYYIVSNTGATSEQSNFWGVKWFIESDSDGTDGSDPLGTDYIIYVKSNVTEPATLKLEKKVNINITVISDNTTPYTISAGQHYHLFDMGNNNLTLENIVLDGASNWTLYPYGISMAGGDLRMESNATIQNYYGDTIVSLTNNSSFYMNGGSISNNNVNGNIVSLTNNSSFRMNGGIISNNNVNGNGGGISLISSTFTMIDGTISDNTAAYNGGGVYLQDSTFTMNGANATISGNIAGMDGGGVYLMGDCHFKMTEGSIDNNKTLAGSGGGVFVFCQATTPSLPDVRFTLSGGTISNNNAIGTKDSKGGGIDFYVDASITSRFDIPADFTGSAIVSGNKASIGGGISVMNASGNPVTLKIDGMKISGNKAVVLENQAGHGGGIGTVNNTGGTIKFIINQGTITSNTSDRNGGGVYCDANTSFEMVGGLIDGNNASSGGGVYYSSSSLASFTMSNGTISNNESNWDGGGLYIGATSPATIDGSAAGNTITISGNKAKSSGGGISFQWGDATLTITNASISGNKITENWAGGGGGVHCGGAADGNWPSITLNYVEITGNSNTAFAAEYWTNTLGSGVYILGTGKLTVSGGKISGNTGANAGGGIYVGGKATTEITNSEISRNTVTGNGGGIYIADDGKEKTDKVKITNSQIISNKAEANGGGINIEVAPNSYLNLTIDKDTKFDGNISQSAYQPPEDVHTNSRCRTITNSSCSEENLSAAGIILTEDTHSPLNNYDINLVIYRIKLTLEDPADWNVLGNIAATFTNTGKTITQTAIFSPSIGEYRGYPEPGTDDNGIEMLPDDMWYVMLNLPYNYTYEVYLNYELSTDNWLSTNETPVKFIEIKVTKEEPLWGKLIYKFKW